MQTEKFYAEISRYSRIFPTKAADGKTYLVLQIEAKDRQMIGKRGKLVVFRATAYATGKAWKLFKAKEIYAGKPILVEGYFDTSLGDNIFRITNLDVEGYPAAVTETNSFSILDETEF